MAFVSFRAEGRTTYGIARPDGVFDLGRRIGSVAPDLKSLLAAQSLGLLAPLPAANTTDYAAGEFTYLPILPNPSKILCVGLNYEEHRVETNRPKATHPTLFTRFADTLTGHNTPMLLPPTPPTSTTKASWPSSSASTVITSPKPTPSTSSPATPSSTTAPSATGSATPTSSPPAKTSPPPPASAPRSSPLKRPARSLPNPSRPTSTASSSSPRTSAT